MIRFWPAAFGALWVRDQGPWAKRFSIWRSDSPATRTWFVRKADVDEGAPR